MGYYTDYKIEVLNGDPFFEVTNAIKCESYYGDTWEGNDLYHATWYTALDDVQKVSERFPDKVIALYGLGEAKGDIWKCYFKNGRQKMCKAIISFDEYNYNDLVSPLKLK